MLETQDPKHPVIKEECVFNKLPEFLVTNNSSGDPIEDIREGFLWEDLALLLLHYIYERKIFTLDYLNTNIRALH